MFAKLPEVFECNNHKIRFADYESVGSTNDLAKMAAEAGAPEGYVCVASQQTAGRGRIGRKFESPKKTGVYFSTVLRPNEGFTNYWQITVMAATALCKTIREEFKIDAQIKWVNDLYINNLKVSGILTEASLASDGKLAYAVLGIGVNLVEPEGGFPEELKGIAGTVFTKDQLTPETRTKLLTGFMTEFFRLYDRMPETTCIEEYRAMSFVPGNNILVPKGDKVVPAFAESISEDFGLVVRYENGTVEELSTGEVSIKGFKQVPRVV